MKRYRVVGLAAGMAATVLFTSSCGLLPAEEELPQAPVVHAYEAQQYETTQVVRGDIRQVEEVDCTYRPLQEESLAFSLGDEPFGQVYVQQGDTVQAGDLLAELEMSDLSDRIQQQSYAVERLQLQISQQEQIKQLEVQKQQLLYDQIQAQLSQVQQQLAQPELAEEQKKELTSQQSQLEQQLAQQQLAVNNAGQDVESTLRQLRDDLTVQQMRLDALQSDKQQRQLFAGISGTVTYVRSVQEGDLSVSGEKFIDIDNYSSAVFAVEGKDCELLTPGDKLTVVSSDESYPVTVIQPQDMGVQPEEGEQLLYLKPDTVDPRLTAGRKGTVEVLLDERTDVLLINEAALKTSGGQNVVYYLDENGLRTAKEVEVGLQAEGKVEMISGVERGESIILR